MNKIQILDCTLRDGGYVNDWRFGKETISAVKNALSQVGVTIAELGFLRDEPYDCDRSIFNHIAQPEAIVGQEKEATIYAGLIEMANYFPEEKLTEYQGGKVRAIRYSFWKRLIDDAYDYCAMIRDKGYLLCCQPTRVEQYSETEFAQMCVRFGKLDPYAVYIVDTFGLITKAELEKYARIANDNLPDGIVLGYHAHNNMNQAFENAKAFIDLDLGNRTKQLDATIGGIGRGAGNLALEQLLEYLNKQTGASYDLDPILEVRDHSILKIKEEHQWGYNSVYQLVAENRCNPNYALYFLNRSMDESQVRKALSLIEGENKYLYSDEKAEYYLQKI